MKNFREFIKKATLFTTLDLSAPTKFNESVINELKEKSSQKGMNYCIFTPTKPHLVFENHNFEVSNLSSEEIQETYNKHEKYQPIINQKTLDDIVESGNIDNFKISLIDNVRDIDAINYFNQLREEFGLEKIKIDKDIKVSSIREKYFKGEVFNKGDFVSFDEEKAFIISKSTNHVAVMSEDGIISNKFITDISESDVGKEFEESKESLINFGYYHSSSNITEEVMNAMEDVELTPENISVIQKIDYLMDDLDSFDSINELHNLIKRNKFYKLYDIIEQMMDEGTDGDHVIYNNKTDVIHTKGFKNRKDAYSHLIGKLKYHPDYTVVHNDNLDKHRIHNAKVKKLYPNRYKDKAKNEVKDYNISNDIVDKDEFVKMKKGVLRNGMTKKKSSVIKIPKVKEQYNFTDEMIDSMVEETEEKSLLEEYHHEEFENAIEGISIAEQYQFNEKLQLKEKSTQGELNNKALRLARTKLRKKLSVVALKDLAPGDRVKLEKIVANNSAAINTIAMKLSPKLKKMELKRLIKKEQSNGNI